MTRLDGRVERGNRTRQLVPSAREGRARRVRRTRRGGAGIHASGAGRELSRAEAIGFHFVDHVVHAWDVAATLGARSELPDRVLGAALAVARRVPADPARRGPGLAFAPVVEVPEGAGRLEETLRLLGRTPEQWPPKPCGDRTALPAV